VSVIIPVRNEEQHLADQLEALVRQTYPGPWEVLVVDNGSTDRTLDVALGFGARLPLRIVDASERAGLNHARNAGVAAAEGEFVAFCDGDDVASPGWLEALVRAARDVDIVAGPLDFFRLNDALYRAWRPDDPDETLQVAHDFLPYAPGGNCGMWTRVARHIRWNGDYRFGSSDTEFSWRAQLAGYTLAFEPAAVVHLRYRRSLAALGRQFFDYGRSGPLLYREFRPHGMTWSREEASDRWRWVARRAPQIFGSVEQRGNWIRMAAFSAGRACGSLRWRVLFL
jgi:glycosyltransferase involved in cell wall biosynthesis